MRRGLRSVGGSWAARLAGVVLAVLVCGLCGLARPARAEAIAIVDQKFEGVSSDLAERFATNVADSLRAAGFGVTGERRVRERLSGSRASLGCSLGPCLRVVGRTLGVELALSVRVVSEGQTYTFTLTVSDMHSGLPLAQVVDTCDVCTADEAEGALTLAVVGLGVEYRRSRDEGTPAQAPVERGIRTATWIMSGAAVALIALGVGLVAAADDDSEEKWGWAALGGGAGLVVGAVLSY